MPDPSDRLRRDGARWRAEVDRRHEVDTDALFERVTSAPVVAPHRWFTGRAPLLLSAAAVTVAALAVGTGVLVTSGGGGSDPTGRGAALTTAAASAAPSGPTGGDATSDRHPLGRHATRATTPATHAPPTTARASKGHHHGRHHSAPPTAGSASAAACDPARLTLSVSAPAEADGQGSVTVTAVNGAAAACTVAGYPAVQLAGDTTVTAGAGTEPAEAVTLAPGGAASAQVVWGAPGTDGCPAYGTALVSLPGAAEQTVTLDPPASVCDPSTLVVHPLTAG